MRETIKRLRELEASKDYYIEKLEAQLADAEAHVADLQAECKEKDNMIEGIRFRL